jgi:hypothetical protein
MPKHLVPRRQVLPVFACLMSLVPYRCCSYDDFGRLKKKFRSADDRKQREEAALARLHGKSSAVGS